MTDGFVELPASLLAETLGPVLARAAARHADRVAVKDRRGALTYRQLDDAAERVWRAIAPRGGDAAPIALLPDHDATAIVAILAAVKTGRPFVPLDSRHPPARLAAILDDSTARLILAAGRAAEIARDLATAEREVLDVGGLAVGGAGSATSGAVAARAPASPAVPAWICYTSGTTGEPKGVVSDHRMSLHRALGFVNGHRVGAGDRVSLMHSLSVSASFRQIFGTLMAGATVLPWDLQADGVGELARWLRDEAVTICHAPASVFRHFAAALPGPDALPALRLLCVGNEPVFRTDVDLFRARFSPRCRFVNWMGSSEAGTVCEFALDAATPLEDETVPIGYPPPGKDVLLLDERGGEVAPGEVGELAVRSEYLGAYWRRPDLDRAAFAPDPAGGPARIYRTGDLARRRPDGCLVHLGRKDARPKLLGQLVDAIEIERRLLEHPGVAGAAVEVRADRRGGQRLVAYVVPAPGAAPTAAELHDFAARVVPPGLVPTVFVSLDALPRTPNGKVDRLALPPLTRGRSRMAGPYVAPATPVESAVARIWADVLDLDEVGTQDPFLTLGGDSLLAAQVVSRVCDRFGLALGVSALLAAPRVSDMADVVVEHWLREVPLAERQRLLDELGRADAQ